ncbi:MAG: hypothetical protein QXH32_06600 [Candidatus Caldarchaeum sp.]
MVRMGSTGLSGVVAAIMITAVMTAGIASTLYINQTSSNLFQRQAEEALRQAKLNQELVRIYVHSQDGTLDTPAYITFVNGWGFETKILKIIVISKNMTVMSEVNLNPPLVINPGRHVRITPSTVGLNHTSFRTLADNVAALIAYTEAGNRFGSTWGFPREDNLAGATTITTYNYTTTRVWSVPSFTTLNRTITLPSITTLNPPPNITYAQIYARAHFEKIRINTYPYLHYMYPLTVSTTVDDMVVQGSPPHQDISGWPPFVALGGGFPPEGDPRSYYLTWYWHPLGGFHTVAGSPLTVERNTYYVVYNSPKRYIVNISGEHGYCVVSYSLARVEINPIPPTGFTTPPNSYTSRKGMVLSFTHTLSRVYSWDPLPRTATWAGGPHTAANPTMSITYFFNDIPVGGHTIPVPTTATTYSLGYPYYNDRGTGYWTVFVTPTNLATLPTQNPVSASYILIGEADTYVVDRYYYVDQVTCNVYTPQPPLPGGSYTGPTCPPDQSCISRPPTCDVVAETSQESSSGSGGGSGGGGSGGSGGGAVLGVIQARFRLVCPPGVLR